MGEELIVAITAHNRPNYLEVVIDSWRAVRGIDDVLVHFQVEPVNEYVKDKCAYAEFNRLSYIENPALLGALSNPHAALQAGFDMGANFVILGEDDSIVMPDVLEYFKWASKEFADDPTVMAACSFQHTPCGPPEGAIFRDYFASVVWGTWRSRWDDWMNANWGHTYQGGEWDFRFCRLCETPEYRCIFPCISRSQHIGKVGGTHMQEDKFERLQAKAVHWGAAPVEWRLI